VIRMLSVLILIMLAAPLRSSDDSPADAKPARPAGTWLKVHFRLFVNPERAQAIYFDHKYLGKDGSRNDVYLIDIEHKTARKLFTLPKALTGDAISQYLHSYAALTEDEQYLLLDKETPTGQKASGRASNEKNAGEKNFRVVYRQRNVYAIPLQYTGEPDAARITKEDGDYNEWIYDPATKTIGATAIQNSKEGFIAFDLAGKRTELWGMVPPPPQGVTSNLGVTVGYTMRGDVCWLDAGVFMLQNTFEIIRFNKESAEGAVQWCHPQHKKGNAAEFPLGSTPGFSASFADLAPTADRKGLLLAMCLYSQNGVQQHTTGQLWMLEKTDGGTWKKVADVAAPQFGGAHSICASADGLSAWTVVQREGNSIQFVSKVDLKTGKLTNVWLAKDIQKIAEDVAK
jgi:hypothetical protein